MQLPSRKAINVFCLVLAWYVLSIGLSLYNKKTVGKNDGLFGGKAFPAPLLMSSIQFISQTALAKAVFGLGWAQRTANRRLPWSEYFRLVVPNGVVTGLDIGLSNKSLVFIGLAFYTMCKSTVPVFLLFFAFVWGIEKPSLELMAVVVVIVSGLALLVRGETEFHWLGFGLVMTASCLSGLRFTLTQVLLHGHQTTAALAGPLEVLEQLTPVMSITAFMFSLAWEKLWDVLPGSIYFSSVGHSVLTLLAIMLGALIAFLMVWTEYQVIKETSALSFMIAGVIKEVITVLAAVIFRHESLTQINVLGLMVVLLGVLLFNFHKYRKLEPTSPQPRKKTKQDEGYTAMEVVEDVHGSDGSDCKPLRRSYGNSSGGGAAAINGVNGGGNTTSPVAAVAAAAAAAAAAATTTPSTPSSPVVGTGGTFSSQQAGPGLLARAIVGLLLNRTQGASGAASAGANAANELRPLLSSNAGVGGGVGGGGMDELPPGYRHLPVLNTARDSDREKPAMGRKDTDVEGMVVGLGNAGDDPAAAMALSGAGISGPQRTARPGARGLMATIETESNGHTGETLVVPSYRPTPVTAQPSLPPLSSSPQLK